MLEWLIVTNIKEILAAYQVNPSEISKVTNKLYKVQSHNYTYALKESSLTSNDLQRWRSVYRIGNDQQLASVLPVYMTNSGDIYQEHKGNIYYLSPWKEKRESDEPEHEIESFYHALGHMHNKTKQENRVHMEKLEELIQQEKESVSSYRNTLLAHIETYEQRRYMSPFELRVCMQYRDLEQVFKNLDSWYDYYLTDLKDDGVSYSSLCHGNLRPSHRIYQASHTYFINWETANFGSPVNDLASYFYHEFKYHDCYFNHLTDSFSIYERYNPLLQSERSLLAIYLLTPSAYLQIIDNYNRAVYKKSQPFQIKYLEQAYRRLMHGLSMQHYLYQVRKSIIEKEQASDNDEHT